MKQKKRVKGVEMKENKTKKVEKERSVECKTKHNNNNKDKTGQAETLLIQVKCQV